MTQAESLGSLRAGLIESWLLVVVCHEPGPMISEDKAGVTCQQSEPSSRDTAPDSNDVNQCHKQMAMYV